MARLRYRIEALNEHPAISGFNNEIGEVRDCLRDEALLDMKKCVARTFVAVDTQQDKAGTVAGYFTLRAYALKIRDAYFDDFYPEPVTSPIFMEVPLAELMWLGCDTEYRGEGAGDTLLLEALKATAEAADRIGLIGLHLRSVPSATAFYEEFGFLQFAVYSSDRMRYFLPVTDIEEILLQTTPPRS